MSLLKSFLHRNGKPDLQTCRVAGLTDVGLVRTLNEDCFLYVRQPWAGAVIAGVADGMGGHEFGEIASYLVVQYLMAEWRQREAGSFASRPEVCRFLTTALNRANSHIFHVNKVLHIRWAMGTTVTVAVFWGDRVVVAQVGDSRCYRWRRNQLKLLTADQNWQAEMVRYGLMTANEATAHPLSNMLTNCVGALRELRIQFDEYTVCPEDRYLFCTDGVSSLLTTDEIAEILGGSADPWGAVRALLELANDCGGNDNSTAVCAFV